MAANSNNKYDDISATAMKPVDDESFKEKRHREVALASEKGKRYSFLKIADKRNKWYNIPLGHVDTENKKSKNAHKNVLIPVIPLCYTQDPNDDPDQWVSMPSKKAAIKNAEAPRENGYLYVYLNGYLWREIKVTRNGCFTDVNLFYIDKNNPDSRIATCTPDNRVLLPYKIAGKLCELEMCYSEFQWSWARINRYGGMDKRDFRMARKNRPKFADEMKVTKEDAKKLREKRFDEINIKVNSDYSFETTVEDGDKARFVHKENNKHSHKCYHVKLDRKAEIPRIYLHDAIGVARNLQAKLFVAATNINIKILKLQGVLDNNGKKVVVNPVPKTKAQTDALKKYQNTAADFQLAGLAVPYLYHSKDKLAHRGIYDTLSKKAKENIDKRKDEYAKEAINETTLFEEYIKTKEFDALVDQIVKYKEKLIRFISEEEKTGNFTAAMHDAFASGRRGHKIGLEIMVDILTFVLDHPAQEYRKLMKDYKEIVKLQKNDPGQAYIDRLIGFDVDRVKLSYCMFPTPKPGHEDNPSLSKVTTAKEGLPGYDTKKMATWTKEDEEVKEELDFQGVRRIAQLVEKLVSVTTDASLENLLKGSDGSPGAPVSNQIKMKEQELNQLKGTLRGHESRRKMLEIQLAEVDAKIAEANELKKRVDVNANKYRIGELNRAIRLLKRKRVLRQNLLNRANAEIKSIKSKIVQLEKELKAERKAYRKTQSTKGISKTDKGVNRLTNQTRLLLEAEKTALERAKIHIGTVATTFDELMDGTVGGSRSYLANAERAKAFDTRMNQFKTMLDDTGLKLGAIASTGESLGEFKMRELLELKSWAMSIITDLTEGAEGRRRFASSDARFHALVELDIADLERENTQLQNQNKSAEKAGEDLVKLNNDNNNLKADMEKKNAQTKSTLSRIDAVNSQINRLKEKATSFSNKTSVKTGVGFSFAIFEAWNLLRAIDAVKNNPNIRTSAKVLSAGLDFAATMTEISVYFAEYRYGVSSEQATHIIKTKGAANAVKEVVVKNRALFASRFLLVANVVSIIVEGIEFFFAWGRGDTGSMQASAIMIAGFVTLIVAASFSSGIGAIIGILVLIFGIFWAKWFADDYIEVLFKNCRFGKNPYFNGDAKSWMDNHEEPLIHLLSVLKTTHIAKIENKRLGYYGSWKDDNRDSGKYVKFGYEIKVYLPVLGDGSNVELIIDIQTERNGAYTRIDLESPDKKQMEAMKKVGIDYAALWKGVTWKPLNDTLGYSIVFPRENFYTLFDQYKKGIFTLRVRLKAQIYGKGQSLFKHASMLAQLPYHRFDTGDGSGGKYVYAESKLRIDIYQFNRARVLYWSAAKKHSSIIEELLYPDKDGSTKK